jgi:hypothetical protein
MFASVFPRLPARLRHALAYIKAFAFLEDPPRAALAPLPSDAPLELPTACAGDRRRGPGPVRGARPREVDERCGTSHSSAGAGRSGRPAPPAQRCATPTTSGERASAPRIPSDRRAAVPGGFLHR